MAVVLLQAERPCDIDYETLIVEFRAWEGGVLRVVIHYSCSSQARVFTEDNVLTEAVISTCSTLPNSESR